MERDAQTDAVLCSEKWVQWPPEDFRGWGGEPRLCEVGGWKVGGGGCRKHVVVWRRWGLLHHMHRYS